MRVNLERLNGKLEKIAIIGAIILAVSVGAWMRSIVASAKYFIDPDTFHHYENFIRFYNGNFNMFYDKVYPPTGDIFSTMPFLYILWVIIAKTLSLFGISTMMGFKVGQVVVFAILSLLISIFTYRVTKSKIGSLASVIAFVFTFGSLLRSYAGNARGDEPFLMFFTALMIIIYELIAVEHSKKTRWILTALNFILFPAMMSVWLGSMFFIAVYIVMTAVLVVYFISRDKPEKIRTLNLNITIPYMLSSLLAIGVYRIMLGDVFTLMHAFNVLIASTVSMFLVSILLFAIEFGVKKTTKERVFYGVLVGGLIIGLIFMTKLSYVVKYATPSYNPISSTIQELTPTDLKSLFLDYSMFGTKLNSYGDGLYYILGVIIGSVILVYELTRRDKLRNVLTLATLIISVISLKYPYIEFGKVGISVISITVGVILLYKMFVAVRSRDDDLSVENIFLAVTVIAFSEILWWASRYIFLSTFMVSVLFAYFVKWVVNASRSVNFSIKSFNMKNITILTLLILFLGSSYVNGKVIYQSVESMKGYKDLGGVPPEWVSALNYIKSVDKGDHTVVTWWDYGYWIESSLLGDHPALIDGAYGREYDYIVAKWFSEPKWTFNWDMFNVRYFIIWSTDIFKMNAINYLGGVINKKEKSDTTPMMVLQYINETKEGKLYTNGYVYALLSNNTTFILLGPNRAVETEKTIINGTVHNSTMSAPTVGYISMISRNYMMIIRNSVYNSNWYAMTSPFNLVSPNIIPVYMSIGSGEIIIYRFFPFLLYGMKTSNSTKVLHFEDTNWTIPANVTMILTSYGRSGTGDLIVKLKNGSEIVLAKNITIDNRTEIKFNNTKIENVSAVYFRTWGPYGKFTGLVRVNGKIARNKDISDFIKYGLNQVEFPVYFNESGVPIRAGVIVYAIVVRDENGYVKTYFRVLDKEFGEVMKSKKGDMNISVVVKLMDKNYYLEKLKKEYGTKNVKYYIIYRPYVEGFKNYLISSETLFKK